MTRAWLPRPSVHRHVCLFSMFLFNFMCVWQYIPVVSVCRSRSDTDCIFLLLAVMQLWLLFISWSFYDFSVSYSHGCQMVANIACWVTFNVACDWKLVVMTCRQLRYFGPLLCSSSDYVGKMLQNCQCCRPFQRIVYFTPLISETKLLQYTDSLLLVSWNYQFLGKWARYL